MAADWRVAACLFAMRLQEIQLPYPCSSQAASNMGQHRMACTDRWAALKALRKGCPTGHLHHSEEVRAAIQSLIDCWKARAPDAGPFFSLVQSRGEPAHADNTKVAAALALVHALHGEGNARLWSRGDGTRDATCTAARRLAVAEAGYLVGAAEAAAKEDDGTTSEALLRLASWICGCPSVREAETALIAGLGHRAESGSRLPLKAPTRLAALTSPDAPLEAAAAALQLVEALACRRVSNALHLQPEVVLVSWRSGKSDAVRRAAASALVWLSRSRRASGWMASLSPETMRPLLTRALALHTTCGLREEWAIDDVSCEFDDETGVCLGDGGD
eukprot:scaffold248121_cov28-Tisochrysis_lutea.AAC.2